MNSLKDKDKAFDNVSLYAFFGIMIPLVIISTCFIMIRMKVKKMRQSLRISQNFTDVSHKDLAQALSGRILKKEKAVTRSTGLVIGTSLALR